MPTQDWVATWQASPQPVWAPDFLFPSNVPSELSNQTVRQLARISLGGEYLRIVLSNTYGVQPVFIGKASIARPEKSNDNSVVIDSLRALTFSGQETATILPGASLVSDPVALAMPALSQVAVSIYLPYATPIKSFHWDGRQTTWIVSGDETLAQTPSITDQTSLSTTARPFLTGIHIMSKRVPKTVVVIGDSITDGATASLDADKRWPDFLAERLAPRGVAVVNAGISGARLLSDGMGVNALARLDRDVLAQPGVQSVIVMLGINDIAWPGTAFAPNDSRPTLGALKAGFSQLVEQAHIQGVRVIGSTLTPFENALSGTPLDNYYHIDKDALREQLNEWIRHSGTFDAVIDFDAVLRDLDHPSRLAPSFDSDDHLHPNDEGSRVMAQAVELDTLLPNIDQFSNTTFSQEP